MKDVIIGAIDNYTVGQVQNWVRSAKEVIDESECDIILISYRSPELVTNWLANQNVIVYNAEFDHFGNSPINHSHRSGFNTPANTITHELRFFHMWLSLQDHDYRFLVTTDVRDVMFQSNPFTWLSNHLGSKQIVAPSEGIQYKNEPWNRDRLLMSHGPWAVNLLKDKEVYNIGTIGGRFDFMRDFFLTLYYSTEGKSYPADQTGFNVLIQTALKDVTLFADHDSGWCCQCGVTKDPQKLPGYRPHLLCKEPVKTDELIRPDEDALAYTMVHQYDRVPEWEKVINDKYNYNYEIPPPAKG